jgi:hypothetical protein
MDWDNPDERARLAIRLGPHGYRKAFEEHVKNTTVAIVNGHRIRPVKSRFGRLYQIGTTNRAHSDLEQAKRIASEHEPGPDTEAD